MSLTIGTVIEFVSNFFKIDQTNNANNTNNPDGFGGGEGIYGGSLAGNRFDIMVYLKKPQVILRLVALFFSIIVFGCIASEDSYKSGECPMNGDEGACKFGITIGVVAFLACLIFLLIDARFDNFSNIKTRRKAVLADLGFSGAWAFMWFICFCYLTDAWRKTDDKEREKAEIHNVQAAIAFSFFSIFFWIALALLGFLRYRQGVATSFSGAYEEHNQSVPENQFGNPPQNQNNDYYRQAPFNTNPAGPTGGYQQPTY